MGAKFGATKKLPQCLAFLGLEDYIQYLYVLRISLEPSSPPASRTYPTPVLQP